jgi:geranylgeranyl diphosphate synthase type I
LKQLRVELKRQVSRLDEPRTKLFHEMLTYHMGWTGEGAGAQATGKRIRAIELVHNFSLVHDDIQDNSDKRRGRNTVWVKWGAPMAINAGDALFVIANQAIVDLIEHYPAEMVVKARKNLNDMLPRSDSRSIPGYVLRRTHTILALKITGR